MTTEELSDFSKRKAEIRRAALARRDALDAALRAELSRAIVARLLALPDFQRARTVLAYAGFGSEIDTRLLLAAALESGKRLLLPRVNRRAGVLDVHVVTDLARDLGAGGWGIPEPQPETCPGCGAEEADWILVPGVAFDRRGGRIGYGRGYYDKLLGSVRRAGNGAPALAAAFDAQVVDEIPMGDHDVPVDRVLTETEFFAGRQGASGAAACVDERGNPVTDVTGEGL